MSRKGQYLAIETVLSLGISLVVATAVIGAFNNYRGSVIGDIEERHANIIHSEALTAIYNLKYLDSGSAISLDLPEPENGEYTVSLQDETVFVGTSSEVYSKKIDGVDWASGFEGSTSNPEVRMIKLENQIVLRPD